MKTRTRSQPMQWVVERVLPESTIEEELSSKFYAIPEVPGAGREIILNMMYKRMAQKEAIGEKQKDFVEALFTRGAKKSMLSKSSRENLIWRIRCAFDEAFENDFDNERGLDNPNIARFNVKPAISYNETEKVYVFKRVKTGNDFFIRSGE